MMFISAGLMSGTSMDGIDAALIQTDGEHSVKQLGNYSITYNAESRVLLKACEQSVHKCQGDLNNARAHFESTHKKMTFDQVVEQSTDLHAEAIEGLLKETGYKANQIDVIGYHGQTLFHNPAAHITIQAGDGQKLANKTGIKVIYDFRSNDIKHGGQGAPLAPLYHQALCAQSGIDSAVVANCGGISNITVISSSDIYAFDCGPGNTLIDRFVQLKTGESMDKDGRYGTAGSVDKEVQKLLRDKAIILKNGENYFDKKPPKSLDVNDIHLISEVQALDLENGCATLEAFTAKCIVDSLDTLPITSPKTWILAGGGWKNKVINRELEKDLKQKFGCTVQLKHADALGWSSQYMEAQVFAYLAVRSLRKIPLSLPSTTGVSSAVTGGQLAIPG